MPHYIVIHLSLNQEITQALFSINQSITQTTQSHTRICICCLKNNPALVYLSNCTHSDVLNNFNIPNINPLRQVVCYQCHAMLRKITEFNVQVQESFRILSTQPDVSELPYKPPTLTTKKTLELQVPNAEQKHEMQDKETRMKNIQAALDIIESNKSFPFARLLDEINRLKDEVLASTATNRTNEENTESPMETGTIAEIVPSCSSDILEMAITNPVLESRQITPSIDEDLKIVSALPNIRVETAISKSMILDNPEITPSAGEGVETHNASAASTRVETQTIKPKNPIRKVKLTRKQLMRERYILTWSKAYLKCPYKCKTCIQGFNFRDNLEDHNVRKHMVDGAACEICMQVHTEIQMPQHIKRHFTRYVCAECNKKFASRDEAVYHYAKQHVIRYKCGVCGYVAEDMKNMRLHRVKKHGFQCERCGVMFATLRRLRWHSVVKHNSNTEGSQDSSSTNLPQQVEPLQSYFFVQLEPTHSEEMSDVDPVSDLINLDNWLLA